MKEIVTRPQARSKGLTRYYTGLPCPRDHYSERRTSNGQCVACTKERLKVYNKSEKGKFRRAKAVARHTMKKRNRATIDYSPHLLAQKPTSCPLCRRSDRVIVFDHCHNSGRFRGWICTVCNKILGLCNDDPKIFDAMAAYLRAHDKSLPVGQHGGDHMAEIFGYG
jgi:hypothetical protein